MGFHGIDNIKTIPNNYSGFDLIAQSLEKKSFNASVFNTTHYDLNTNSLYSGIDWLYTYVETIYMYDYNVLYFWLLNSIYDESIDFFFISM